MGPGSTHGLPLVAAGGIAGETFEHELGARAEVTALVQVGNDGAGPV